MKLNEQNIPAETERGEGWSLQPNKKEVDNRSEIEVNIVNQYPCGLSARFYVSFLWKEKSPLDA